jgi:hypothetical protein
LPNGLSAFLRSTGVGLIDSASGTDPPPTIEERSEFGQIGRRARIDSPSETQLLGFVIRPD